MAALYTRKNKRAVDLQGLEHVYHKAAAMHQNKLARRGGLAQLPLWSVCFLYVNFSRISLSLVFRYLFKACLG